MLQRPVHAIPLTADTAPLTMSVDYPLCKLAKPIEVN
jgi:hypothetical protein